MDTQPKRGVRVREHPSGKKSIVISFTYQGERCQPALKGVPATKNNVKYAERLLARIEDAKLRETFNFADFPEIADYPKAKLFGHVNTTRLEDYSANWLDFIEHTKPHSTLTTYSRDLGYSLAILGGHQMRKIQPGHIKNIVLKEWSTLSASTIRNYLLPLRAIFASALNDGVILKNPFDQIVVDKLLTDEQKARQDSADPFSKDEINKILKEALKHSEAANIQFSALFYTGLRLSEFMGLEWQDLDFVNDEITVRRAIVMRKEKGPKTISSAGTVPLLPMAKKAFLTQQKTTRWQKGRVFRRISDGGELFDYEHINRVWRTVLKRAGVRYRPAKQTRHSFASNLLTDGENPYFVAYLLRHKTVEMVFRTYGRWIKNSKVKFVSNYGQ